MNKTATVTLATLMHVSTVFVMVACGNATPGDTEGNNTIFTLSAIV